MQDREHRSSAQKDEARKDVAAACQQQHTGNHERHEREDGQPYGADSFGGTRAGAENVEPRRGADKGGSR